MNLGTLAMLLSIGVAAPAAATSAPPPGTAAVANTPDAVRLAAVRADVGPHVARVTCAAGTFEFTEARMDSTGIWSANEAAYRSHRQALIVGGDVQAPKPPPKPIAWAIVDSIGVGRSLGWKGAKVGAALGLVCSGFAIGFSQSVAEGTTLSGSAAIGTVVIGSTLAGALVGAALAAPSKHWRTVFRRGD